MESSNEQENTFNAEPMPLTIPITITPAKNFSEENARALKPIIQRFIQSYRQKPMDMTDESWLTTTLSEELPDEPPETIQAMTREICGGISAWNENIQSVRQACAQGQSTDSWLANKLQETAVGMNVAEYGQYLSNIDATLRANNEALINVIQTNSGAVNMNPNLDGFMAEQEIVNSFNREAALQNSSFRAEVLNPAPGEAYSKNSVDIVIRDTSKPEQNIVRRYQAKYGKDAKHTAKYLLDGDYRGQRAVVPKGQKGDVQSKLQEKGSKQNATDYIESPDGKIRSKPISKEQAGQHRDRVQQGKKIRRETWNSYNTRELALHIGKEAAFAGLAGAAIGTGFHLAVKVMSGEEITADEVIETALTTGVDTGIKTAAAGALTVGVRKGLVPMLAKGTPAGVIATVAAAGIESVKTIDKYMSGEITGREALDEIGRNSCAMAVGTAGAIAAGAALGSVVPVVGTFIGGVVGYMAGSEVGSTIYKGAKKLASVAVSAVSSVCSTVCDIGSSIVRGNGSVFSILFG